MKKITKAENQRPKTKNQLIWLFFALAIVAVYLFALGGFPLVGPDEPRYAQVAREMFERGDFVTPTLGGANWFEKPVLLYWLQIASYKIFGVSEFAARFGPALFGLGTILSLWILGRFSNAETQRSGEIETAKTEDQKPKTDFANWLALIAASSVGLLVFSRGASFDIILTFPITASLVCYFLFETYLQKQYLSEISNSVDSNNSEKTASANSTIVSANLFLVGFYIFVGLALLAKGLVGIVFPFAIIFFYHILKREFLPGGKFLLSLIWGTILSLLIASVWYLPMYLTHGWTFIDEFFVQHHFQRYTSNKYQHPQPFYFFFWVLPLMTLPWLPFFLGAILKFLANKFHIVRFSRVKVLEKNSQLSVFAMAWTIVPLVFFSFSGSKLPGYILPALPAALILTADCVWRFLHPYQITDSGSTLSRVPAPRRKIALQILAFLAFAAAALLLQFAAPKFASQDSVKNLVESANAKGFAGEKITNLFAVSHNAEFYASGRLIRTEDGKLKRYDDFLDLVNDLKQKNTAKILVFVPHNNTKDITESPLVESEILGDNGDTAIVLVRAK